MSAGASWAVELQVPFISSLYCSILVRFSTVAVCTLSTKINFLFLRKENSSLQGISWSLISTTCLCWLAFCLPGKRGGQAAEASMRCGRKGVHWVEKGKLKLLVAHWCPTLCDPTDLSRQVPLSMGYSRQEHWSGLPCPSPGDLPDPGTEPRSPTLQAYTLSSEPPGNKPQGRRGKGAIKGPGSSPQPGEQ